MASWVLNEVTDCSAAHATESWWSSYRFEYQAATIRVAEFVNGELLLSWVVEFWVLMIATAGVTDDGNCYATHTTEIDKKQNRNLYSNSIRVAEFESGEYEFQ